jgi:esterase/lipase superfamily enzyme
LKLQADILGLERLALLWGLIVCAAVASSLRSEAQNVTDTEQARSANRTISQALEAVGATRTEYARMGYKTVLFATNRKTNFSARARARQERRVLRYEDVFLNVPDPGLSYGWALVSYPMNRRKGQQNYGQNSIRQNPLFDFSVQDVALFGSPDQFRRFMESISSSGPDLSFLYVHGFNQQFRRCS